MESLMTVTEKAKKEILRLKTDENTPDHYGLRIGVKTGGCSGLSYTMDFGEEALNDHIEELGEFRIFIDPSSTLYLKDIILDYEGGLKGKGLVFNNPNAKKSCSCGESFAV